MSEILRNASWGNYPDEVQVLESRPWLTENSVRDLSQSKTLLPYGMGRSYGDSCLNSAGRLLATQTHNHFLSFDQVTGVLRCESGVSFEEIIRFIMPRGWFLPVTPGTKFVTVGGALANDVHGKNHHRRGTFGCHVRQFRLVRSDGSAMICSPTENTQMFAATIGGLGLTGFIDWVEFQMTPVSSAFWDVETIKFGNLNEFLAIEEESQKDFEYTVSWIDGLSTGNKQGRGHFIRGNPSKTAAGYPRHKTKLSIPVNFPSWALNPVSIKSFNFLYFHRQISRLKKSVMHYDPFFYPLDAISNWNRIYGKRGFVQYQFVIPNTDSERHMRKIMQKIASAGSASFLTVLKRFGDVSSPGMLSFPRPGLTYALDFPASFATFKLLSELDQDVQEAGGAIYPAKDARMSRSMFRHSFSRVEEFSKHIDPRFMSDFWRRVASEYLEKP